MPDLVHAPWFWWAVGVAVGVPVLLVVLTELNSYLVRRRKPMARSVRFLRTYIVPLAGVWLVLRQVSTVPTDNDWVRVTATALGFLVLVAALSSLNAALFLDAANGTWRQRLPSIFIDIIRVLVIGVGLALLFSWVWGTDISGLFAALGVTSLVLGFALQNAVGSIVSGLLLLFEQPFKLGDWIKTGSGTGRIVEVNWRAMHIDEGNGIVIIPNATLAGGAFTNLSRPTNAFVETVESTFSVNDAPLAVMALLTEVASGLPNLWPGSEPSTVMTGAGTFATSIPVVSFAFASSAAEEFRLRAWYASRRVNLTMDGADIAHGEDAAAVAAVLPRFAKALRVDAEQIPDLARLLDLQRYAAGETVQAQGVVPPALRYVVSGRVSLGHTTAGGTTTGQLFLEAGDALGHTCLTREPASVRAVAVAETTLLVIPQTVLDDLVHAHPALARDLGRQIDQRRSQIRKSVMNLPQTLDRSVPGTAVVDESGAA